MSLAYGAAGGILPGAFAAFALSVAAHVAVPLSIFARASEPQPEVVREEMGLQGAILFDLSDLIAAPSDAGEDSAEVTEAEDAPTVAESPEAVHAARAADEPLLNQTPYAVEEEDLKFGIASPEPMEKAEEATKETAQEFEEEQIDQLSQLGAVAAEASKASVSGLDVEARAEKAEAMSEGLTDQEKQEITEWQKAMVLRIAKAKSYPASARKKGLEGEVMVKFTLDRYGAVLACEVHTSSGHVELDRAALEVFDGLGKLPTPPNHLSGDSFTLVVPLNYVIRKG